MISEAFAPAKINLTLHVTGQRADGYHLLDSLVAFSDVGDRLWFERQDHLSLRITGPFAQGVPADARNLVWQAAECAEVTAGITLEKNLPHGAGIGGGSSDAAALLRHFGAQAQATRLGSDVPVCLTPVAQRMRGTGDQLTPVVPLPLLWAVLVNPKVHVPTPDVFKALTAKENEPMPQELPLFGSAGDMIRWLATQRNDLAAPAITLAPQIADVLKVLSEASGTHLARMSGSGATCFALFDTPDAAASVATDLAASHPKWWVRDCRLS